MRANVESETPQVARDLNEVGCAELRAKLFNEVILGKIARAVGEVWSVIFVSGLGGVDRVGPLHGHDRGVSDL